ncbi:hypothetical protein [Selenomonas ruminantium]|uniref:Lipoprotein n=1 Tax=Selenomonas ruminantium TaxID=971 RepID=A0A1H3Z495_SELRU|nr:hypothetical protein [Selenomonas ruminantium]SEA18507.1 hypothetical protein SAMN05660648_02261 [Selenomonas ruminantium]
MGRKLLLLMLVAMALLICGCGSKSSDDKQASPAEQLAAYEKWENGIVGELKEIQNTFNAQNEQANKEISKHNYDKAINIVSDGDKSIMSSRKKIENMEIPAVLQEKHKESLKKAFDDALSWVDKIHEANQATIDSYKAGRQNNLSEVYANRDKIKSLVEPAKNLISSMVKNMLSVKNDLMERAGKSSSSTAENTLLQDNKQEINASKNGDAQVSTNSAIPTVQRILSNAGITDKVVATSYGKTDRCYLTKLDDGEVFLMDNINQQLIGVVPEGIIEQISSYRGSAKKTIKFGLYIFNDKRDNDAENGTWDGNNHILPVSVEYNYENGKHVPYMIKSGSGASPASYDNYLYEQKNVDAVNMIIEEAAAMK